MIVYSNIENDVIYSEEMEFTGGGSVIPSNAVFYDDLSPVFYDDDSYVLYDN